MQKHKNNFTDTKGNAYVGASVTVYDVGTTNAATLYEDDESTTKANPLTTDANGMYSFKAADGDYDLKFEKSGVTTTYFLDKQSLDRAGVKTSLAALTGASFDFIQDATPTATAADEWWLKTDTGAVYVSTGTGTGNWTLSYQIIILSNGVYTINQGDVKLGNNYLLQSQTIQDIQPSQALYFTGEAAGGGSVLVSDHTSYAELFANGGTYVSSFKALSAGGNDRGIFFEKNGVTLRYNDSAGIFYFAHPFSGDNAIFTFPAQGFGNDDTICLRYDNSSISNTAKLSIGGVPLTVTVFQAPTGTASVDTGSGLYFANIAAANATWDGTRKGDLFLNYEVSDDYTKALSSNPNMAIDPADEGGSNVEVLTSWANSDFDTFTSSGADITSAISDGTGNHNCYSGQTYNFVKGHKYRFPFAIAGTPGSNLQFRIDDSTAMVTPLTSTVLSAAGDYIVEWTATETVTAYVGIIAISAACNFSMTWGGSARLGCTYRAKPQDIIDGFWKDSMNGNHGVITGGEIVNKSEQLVPAYNDVTVTLAATTSGTITLNSGSDVLYCEKLGRKVSFQGRLLVDSVSSPVGVLRIEGLQYTASTETEEGDRATITIKMDNLGSAVTGTLLANIDPGADYVAVYDDANTTNNISVLFAAKIAAGTRVWVSGFYFTDD